MPQLTDNHYPWQQITASMNLALSCKLKDDLDATRLKQEVDAVLANYKEAVQFGEYHDGGWKAVSLKALDGKYWVDHAELDGNYQKTEAIRLTPYAESLIDEMQCEVEIARFLRLEPKQHIYWHMDPLSINHKVARLHIPIVTNDLLEFQISHEDLTWKPGELWYGDFSFPHRLYNGDDQSRIHLVLDCVVNDWLRSLFPPGILQAQGALRFAQLQCYSMWAQMREQLKPKTSQSPQSPFSAA